MRKTENPRRQGVMVPLTDEQFEEIRREAVLRDMTCATIMRSITFAELRRQRGETTE
jgi:hypothetical protein